jgi:hypothetical protein
MEAAMKTSRFAFLASLQIFAAIPAIAAEPFPSAALPARASDPSDRAPVANDDEIPAFPRSAIGARASTSASAQALTGNYPTGNSSWFAEFPADALSSSSAAQPVREQIVATRSATR